MNKKDYQLFAEVLAEVTNDNEREKIINFLYPIFIKDNHLFNIGIFKEFIRRRLSNESLKGLNCNKAYLLKPFEV